MPGGLGYPWSMRLARWVVGIGWIGLLACGVACGDDSSVSPPATGGGKGGRSGGGGVKPPPVDAGGSDAEDEDGGGGSGGGGADEPLGIECTNVKYAPFGETMNGDYFNSIGEPADFRVTRVVATWDTGCEPARVKLIMSDGSCPRGDGHELTFFIDVETVLGGENTVLPESADSTVRVRYTRPRDLEPAGTWGSCTAAHGMFSLKDTLDPNDPGNVQATFQLELSPCDGMATGMQTVNGTLNATMRRSLKNVCGM